MGAGESVPAPIQECLDSIGQISLGPFPSVDHAAEAIAQRFSRDPTLRILGLYDWPLLRMAVHVFVKAPEGFRPAARFKAIATVPPQIAFRNGTSAPETDVTANFEIQQVYLDSGRMHRDLAILLTRSDADATKSIMASLGTYLLVLRCLRNVERRHFELLASQQRQWRAATPASSGPGPSAGPSAGSSDDPSAGPGPSDGPSAGSSADPSAGSSADDTSANPTMSVARGFAQRVKQAFIKDAEFLIKGTGTWPDLTEWPLLNSVLTLMMMTGPSVNVFGLLRNETLHQSGGTGGTTAGGGTGGSAAQKADAGIQALSAEEQANFKHLATVLAESLAEGMKTIAIGTLKKSQPETDLRLRAAIFHSVGSFSDLLRRSGLTKSGLKRARAAVSQLMLREQEEDETSVFRDPRAPASRCAVTMSYLLLGGLLPANWSAMEDAVNMLAPDTRHHVFLPPTKNLMKTLFRSKRDGACRKTRIFRTIFDNCRSEAGRALKQTSPAKLCVQDKLLILNKSCHTATVVVVAVVVTQNHRAQLVAADHQPQPVAAQVAADHQPQPVATQVAADHQPRPVAAQVAADHQPRPVAA